MELLVRLLELPTRLMMETNFVKVLNFDKVPRLELVVQLIMETNFVKVLNFDKVLRLLELAIRMLHKLGYSLPKSH
jgi:hypothetical protein